MRQNHVDAVYAKRIAVAALGRGPPPPSEGGCLLFSLALLERLEIIQHVVPHFFQIFGDLRDSDTFP